MILSSPEGVAVTNDLGGTPDVFQIPDDDDEAPMVLVDDDDEDARFLMGVLQIDHDG